MSDDASAAGFAEDRIILAGEYVLGTLPAEERARVAEELRFDSVLSDDVAAWERHLFPLAAAVAPMAPPASLWPRIERSARAGHLVSARPRRRVTSSLIWKGATAASFLLAASIAFVVLMDRVPMALPVAVLSPVGGPEAAFVVEMRSNDMLDVLPVHPAAVPAGRDLELWSLADNETVPRSLGLLPATGRKLRGAMLPRGPGKILISLEPSGGAPGGLPTGPVLYRGVLSPSD